MANSIPLSINISTVNSKASSDFDDAKPLFNKAHNKSKFRLNNFEFRMDVEEKKKMELSKSLGSSESDNCEFYTAKNSVIDKDWDAKCFDEYLEDEDSIEERKIAPVFMQVNSTPFTSHKF